MVNVENCVESEKQVWEEFRMRMEGANPPLPREFGFNLLLIAEVAVRLVDVLDSENLVGDPEYQSRRQFAPEVLRRSNEWGEWR